MAFLTGWSYRKSVTLSRASGAVTNYQMKLLVGESAGATGENVDCGSKCKTDFSDLRFTTSDETTLLDYWIESVSGTTPNQLATVWIEFDSIGTGATTFWMYYGNAGAAAVSSGANTFILFDDFERGNDGDAIGGAWTLVQGGAEIDTAQKYAGSRSVMISRTTVTGFAYQTLAASSGVNALRCRVRAGTGAAAGSQRTVLAYRDGTSQTSLGIMNAAGNIQHYYTSWVDSGTAITLDAWQLFEIRNINFTAKTYDIYYNDSLLVSGANMQASTTNPNQVRVLYSSSVAESLLWVDDFLVRNWRSTEPAWGSWGTEESSASPVPVFLNSRRRAA